MPGPTAFHELSKMREKAEVISREERARDAYTRLMNSSPKPLTDYRVGEFVCAWRHATLRARRRGEHYNPEARFIGPGRIVLIEPAVFEDRKRGVLWALCGNTSYRCQEVTLELIRGGSVVNLRKNELLKRLRTNTDVSKETFPDSSEYAARESAGARDRPRGVEVLKRTWASFVSW